MRRSLKNDSDGEEIDTHKITREKDFHSDVECRQTTLTHAAHLYKCLKLKWKKWKWFFLKKKYCFFCILPKVMYNIIRDFVLARIRYLFLLIASSRSSIFKRTKKNPSTSFFSWATNNLYCHPSPTPFQFIKWTLLL